jgi:DNA-binding NarL/FixJ family response regulator
LCRTAAISISEDEKTTAPDVRISVGIGEVSNTVGRKLAAAKDEAFVLSGRAFEEMEKQGSRLIISTPNTLANAGLQVIADYLNAIFKEMTSKQATVIFELLKGRTQQQVSRKLKKSKSTINQHVNSGRWPEIERLIQQFKNIVNHLL